MKEKQRKKKIALALQGGGSHGAFTWGILDKFLQSELLEIEGISGTSAGGMNAVALIQGLMLGGTEGAREMLGAFWNEISELNELNPAMVFSKFFKESSMKDNPFFQMSSMANKFFSPYEMNPFDNNLLRNFLSKFFKFEALQKFKKTKLFLCATHVKSGKLRIFNLKELSLEVMLASSCLPNMFQAVEVNGEHYWDGGFVGNPAIYPLIYECETPDIIVIQLTPSFRDQIPYTAQEIAHRHKEITFNACLMREMRSIILITEMIDKGLIKNPEIKRLNMHLIKNEELFQNLDISTAFNTDKKFLFELYEAGYKTAEKWLDENYEKIGKQSTAELKKDFADF